ncbi:MAG: TetR/AcrR family transcriptional regulator [Chloroflexi bacterium]|nr:TetR/AcrR family transcriptional regulator [Chloroflexota bacterium]
MSETSQDLTKGDQARAEILEAAKTLFLAQGYNGTSMRAIAQVSGGRAVGGLYNHFATKEAIFHALIEERNPYGVLFDILERAVDEAETAPDFVAEALRSVLTVMPRYYDFLQLVQIDLREFEGRNLRSVLAQVFPRVMTLIGRVETLPGIKPMPAIVWVRLLASVTIGYLVTEQLALDELFDQISQFSHDEWHELFIDVMLHGLVDRDAGSEGMVP